MRYVPLYAAALALLFVALSVRTLKLRRLLKIAIGDSGNQQMIRAMRVHANFAEYTPIAVLLLYMAESSGNNPVIINVLCLALLTGRSAHAFGVSQVNENYKFRVFGMAMTLTTIICASLLIIYLFFAKSAA